MEPNIFCLTRQFILDLRTHRVESEKTKKRHSTQIVTKAKVAILVSGKIDFGSKIVTRHKEWHYIMIKESIHQKYITIKSTYEPNIRGPKYMTQTLTELKGTRDNFTTIIGNINSPLAIMDKISRQIKQEIQGLNTTADQSEHSTQQK